MNETRLIWTVIIGAAGLTVYRSIRETNDPIPQLAGIGATGAMLLLMAEVQPKLASSFAVLIGIVFALNWEQTKPRSQQITELLTDPNRNPTVQPGISLPPLPGT